MIDHIRKMGSAAFGTRLRRLSELLDRQVQAIYRDEKLGFEPRWFPIVSMLRVGGVLSVGELAVMLGISHAAISQLRGELIAAGLVRGKADPADRRRQLLELTAAGKRMVSRLDPAWRVIADVTQELLAQSAPRLLEDMARLEAALLEQPMNARVRLALVTD